MTRDELIEAAAKAWYEAKFPTYSQKVGWADVGERSRDRWVAEIGRYYAVIEPLIRADENKACVAIAENHSYAEETLAIASDKLRDAMHSNGADVAFDIATAIRNRMGGE